MSPEPRLELRTEVGRDRELCVKDIWRTEDLRLPGVSRGKEVMGHCGWAGFQNKKAKGLKS